MVIVLLLVVVTAPTAQHKVFACYSFPECGFYLAIKGYRDQSMQNSSEYTSRF